MQAIVICSTGNIGLNILLLSIKAYCPNIPVYLSSKNVEDAALVHTWIYNVATNFGDAYNEAMSKAFYDGYDEIIIANDDVVITPTTYEKLQDDVKLLKRNFENIGFVGARSDYVLWDQNIRCSITNDSISGLKYESEDHIKEVGVIAPIFAYVSKQAFETARFPSTNWYSDNIICDDLSKAGFRHFVSRAYVHHAGSQTVGTDFQKCHEEPREWIRTNRPDKYEEYYGTTG
jgi:hypothetical protein